MYQRFFVSQPSPDRVDFLLRWENTARYTHLHLAQSNIHLSTPDPARPSKELFGAELNANVIWNSGGVCRRNVINFHDSSVSADAVYDVDFFSLLVMLWKYKFLHSMIFLSLSLAPIFFMSIWISSCSTVEALSIMYFSFTPKQTGLAEWKYLLDFCAIDGSNFRNEFCWVASVWSVLKYFFSALPQLDATSMTGQKSDDWRVMENPFDVYLHPHQRASMTINDWTVISWFGRDCTWSLKLCSNHVREWKSLRVIRKLGALKKCHEMKCDDFDRMHLDFYWPVDVIICVKWLWIQWKARRLQNSFTAQISSWLVITVNSSISKLFNMPSGSFAE